MKEYRNILIGIGIAGLIGISIWISKVIDQGFLIWIIWIMFLIIIGIIEYRKHLEKVFYQSLIENIYILETHPKSGLGFDLPEDLEELGIVKFAPKSRVIQTVKSVIGKLEDYENQFYVKCADTDPKRIIVFPIWFRDGENINEDYYGEEKEDGEQPYQVRAIRYIRKDRQNRHALIKSKDPAWYELHHHGQSESFEDKIRKWIF